MIDLNKHDRNSLMQSYMYLTITPELQLNIAAEATISAILQLQFETMERLNSLNIVIGEIKF